MKAYSFFLFLFLAIGFFPVFTTAQVPEGQKFTGNWSGKPELPAATLEIIFKISTDETGRLISTMDVPAQGAKDLAVTETSVNGDSLKLSVGMIMGKFEGKLISDTIVEGMWTQRGARLPLTLKKVAVVTAQKRPQTPKEPFPYGTEEVDYVNPASGLKLAGTLTVPENAKNCPAVILITGSGAQDRDETIFEHRPFAVIADFLTRNGVAVLRVDDRGVGGSEGNLTEATSEDFVADVMAGIQFLKSKKTIDAGKIGLIGHSEGGSVAPMVAAKTNDVAFVVLLAGPGAKGEEILYAQNDLVLAAAGMERDVIDRNRQLQKAIFDILLNEKDSVKQIDRLRRTYSGGMYLMLNDDQKKAVDTQVNAVNNRWFRFFLSYDPYPTLTRVKCPVLALNGAKDVQVPARQNLEAIQKALAEGGNGRFTTIQLENLNHLFQHCKTGAVAEYRQIEETISPEVLEIIDGWIQEVVQKN